MPENISNIAKYNIENGTHFWKLSQVNQHKQQKAAEEFEKKHPILASFTKSAQDARDAKIGAVGAGQVRDLYNTGNSALASELNQKYLGANATGILNVPIGSEIATYGLLGGGLRLGAGTATGAAGSWLGGKAGDLADKQFGTNWIGTAGRIGGGFAGFVPGMNAATRVLRTAAGKGVTLYMPQNTFMGLRGQTFDNIANKTMKISVPTIVDKNIFAGKLGWAPKQSRVIWHNSETPISKLKSTFPTWDVTERGAPLGHVWTTGTETTQGFIGARPYHNIGVVELNKPMIQLNESIGNGKNAVRNEILQFADQSGADAVHFSNIKDNTLSNQDVYAVFKDVNVKPKLTEAERLGIPKGERSNPKALEDPYYWGYKQWNSRYNDAVNSENLEEIQRLRDLHFKIKAPHTAAENVVSHGSKTSDNTFNIFNTDIRKNGWNGELTGGAFFGSGDQQALNQFARDSKLRRFYLNIEKPNIIDAQNRRYDNLLATWLTPEEVETRISGLRKNGFSESSIEDWLNKTAYGGTAEDYAVKTMLDKNYDSLIIKNVYEGGMSKDYGTPITDYVATKPTQIKLWDSKTYDNTGEIIPIVKRDNFRNPDIRYKQGGILKAQNGKSFENWYKIVPEDKNDTTSYNLRRAYELAPKEELEAFVTDPKAHLRSAYPTKEGNIEFVKSITHPSLLWELADYNSKPKFNKEWKLSVLKYPYLQCSK